MAAVRWSDEVDAVLAGDATAVLAYVTPAGGCVATAVAPIGLRDRDAGRVLFTTSLGLGRKLERLRRDPSVALAYHAREHGFASSEAFVLVQGRASFDARPDPAFLRSIEPNVERFLGKPRHGRFWDRWLREYYEDRVAVTVDVERVATWPDGRCAGVPDCVGAPWPSPPPSQRLPDPPPQPAVDCERARRRLAALAHVLLAYRGADGLPVVVPVGLAGASAAGVELAAAPGALPPGTRRAGLLGHRFGPQLVGLAARQHTGWLLVDGESARYVPRTDRGFRAPSNKTLLLLGNGLLAKRGLRAARRQGRVEALSS